MVHTSRFAAYRRLVGAKAKSDTSDARLLAAYAASPDEVRGRKADHVEILRMPCATNLPSSRRGAINSNA